MPSDRMRLIIDQPQSGVWNMAVDEALLDTAINQGIATLRFYQWAEPTLSLGYFQNYAERESHTASLDCPCVRRHSGGGAIMHDRELTYSLALPVERLGPGGAEGLYRLAHASLISVLQTMLPAAAGSRLRLCETAITRPPADEPFLCFLRRTDGDLLVQD
ncbi:MAG: lipoate--protein ligase family protein, partial [Planctomycetota bacterium]